MRMPPNVQKSKICLLQRAASVALTSTLTAVHTIMQQQGKGERWLALATASGIYLYFYLDIVYSSATSDHQGVSQEQLSTLVSLHWHLSTALTTQLHSDLGE